MAGRMLSGEGNFPANLQTMNGAPLSPCRAAAQFNKSIEPMTSSAVRQRFQFRAVDALLVTAHPSRSML